MGPLTPTSSPSRRQAMNVLSGGHTWLEMLIVGRLGCVDHGVLLTCMPGPGVARAYWGSTPTDSEIGAPA